MARGDVRIAATLACEECKRRNYQTNKSRRNTPDRIEMSKYCTLVWPVTPRTRRLAESPMAKSRAQRKAEARKRRERAEQGDRRGARLRIDGPARHPGAGVGRRGRGGAGDRARRQETPRSTAEAPAPARIATAREQRPPARRRPRDAPRSRPSAAAAKEPVVEREHGAIRSFFSSVIKELRKVQWPDRDTLVQASAVTVLFVAVAAAYLGCAGRNLQPPHRPADLTMGEQP